MEDSQLAVQNGYPDVEEIQSEIDDADAHIPVYTIASYPTDPTLELLHIRWGRKEIEIPEFQRGWVWTKNQPSRLIESFLLGLPVPGIFLYREQSTQHLLVIDGQQRLRTIFGFFDGVLPTGEDFYLREVDPRWEGKRFKDLSGSDQIRLRDAVLRATIIEQSDPNDNSSKYHIFERLNTGGTQLNPQEIRNSLAHGPFNDMIVGLNEYPNWRRIFGGIGTNARLRDVELIVRFFALYEGSSSYTKPMKTFLNDFMKKHQGQTSPEPYKGLFTGTVTKVLEALGPRPFHIKRGINAAVFDSVMIAFARSDVVPQDIKSRWDDLLENPSFVAAISRGTTDESNVKNRIGLALHTLFS